MITDIHCHYVPDQFFRFASARPEFAIKVKRREGDAGPVIGTAQDIDADAFADREKSKILVSHIDSRCRREPFLVRTFVGGQHGKAATDRDLPFRHRSAERAHHNAGRTLPFRERRRFRGRCNHV